MKRLSKEQRPTWGNKTEGSKEMNEEVMHLEWTLKLDLYSYCVGPPARRKDCKNVKEALM
jgi:hypothetical protein